MNKNRPSKNIISFIIPSALNRDGHLLFPVLLHLKNAFNYNFHVSSPHFWRLKLMLCRVDLVLLPNSIGSAILFEISKFCHFLGIPCITLISEGDYSSNINSSREETAIGFWGFNSDRVLYQDLLILWSRFSAKLLSDKVDKLNTQIIRVSGATGFDRYKICNFQAKSTLLNKYSKGNFSKVIGIASWNFGVFYKDSLEHNRQLKINYYFLDENRVTNQQKCRDQLNSIYREIIQKNEDKLFILKLHPQLNETIEESEFLGLYSFKNILILQKEEPIEDIINACDLWLAYESTTALEAWLLHKPTLIVDPLGAENVLIRSIISKGSPHFREPISLNNAIHEFFETGKIEDFNKLESERSSIIKMIIEHDDGKNHERAANIVHTHLSTSAKKRKVFAKYTIKQYLIILRDLFHTIIKQKSPINENSLYNDDTRNLINLYKNSTKI